MKLCKLISVLLTLAMVVSLFAGITITASAATTRCDVTADWQPWTSTTTLPITGGYYYLQDNVTVENACWIGANQNVYLDLNGKTVKVVHKDTSLSPACEAYDLRYANSSLHLYDSVGGGVIDGGANHIILLWNGSAKFYMYGGTLTGTYFQYNDKGGGLCIFDGSAEMHGGTITGCKATGGAGVYVGNSDAFFTMYGGTIEGNTATEKGGGILSDKGTVNIVGGTIGKNTAPSASGVYSTGKLTYGKDAEYSVENKYFPTMTSTVTLRNGTESSSFTATFTEALPAVTVPTREGYTFNGYFDAVTGGTQYYNADGTGAKIWDTWKTKTLYARWAPIVTPVVPENDPAAPSVQAKIGKDGLSTVRFMWKLNTAEEVTLSDVGAYIIPWDLRETEMQSECVRTENVTMENGNTFSADLTAIPSNRRNVLLYAVPFVNGEAFSGASIQTTVDEANIDK